MSERIMFEVKPPRIGEAREFRTFQDIMAEAVLAAHVEVGTEPAAAAKYILARLDALGLSLGPKYLRVEADGSLGAAWPDLRPGPVVFVEDRPDADIKALAERTLANVRPEIHNEVAYALDLAASERLA